LSILQFKQFKTIDFSGTVGSALKARNDKVEAKSPISQKEIRPRSKREARAHSESASIIYVVNPLDVIPDALPALGFLDDATVLALAVRRSRQTLDDFMPWEQPSYRDRDQRLLFRATGMQLLRASQIWLSL
jgi:uncharacterized membrane protein YkvA (DUF1232 family)